MFPRGVTTVTAYAGQANTCPQSAGRQNLRHVADACAGFDIRVLSGQSAQYE
jgi:hypothetical protein